MNNNSEKQFYKNFYKSFKPIIDTIMLPFYKDLEPVIHKAKIKLSLEEYLGQSFFYSLIISVIFFIFSFILGSFFILHTFKNPRYIVLIIPISIASIIIGFLLGVFIFQIYPYSLVASRNKKIENSLYLATIYMSTIAGSGAPPIAMFDLLSKYKEFGEITEEAKDIVYLVRGLGLSFPKALEIKAKYSPNPKWKELLEGIKSRITEGGDLESFLLEKAKHYISDYRRKITEYSASLQVFLEIYITMVVVGIIFVLILTSLMGSMMGGNIEFIKNIQYFVVLVGLPMASILFMMLIKAISPFDT